MTERKKPVEAIPVRPETVEFDPKKFGFSLAAGENVLLVLEELDFKSVKAAQKPHKFAWR